MLVPYFPRGNVVSLPPGTALLYPTGTIEPRDLQAEAAAFMMSQVLGLPISATAQAPFRKCTTFPTFLSPPLPDPSATV